MASRVEKSNAAHYQKILKYRNKSSKKGVVRYVYHHNVLKEQQKRGRVIPLRERKRIFSSVKRLYDKKPASFWK